MMLIKAKIKYLKRMVSWNSVWEPKWNKRKNNTSVLSCRDLCKPFSFQTCTHKHISEENNSVFTLIPPLPLLQTKPVVTMATDSKEAKLDARVEVTVSEGPGKQKQSEDLCKRPALKVTVTKQLKKYNFSLYISTVSLRTVWCFNKSHKNVKNCVLCLPVSLKEELTQNLQFCQ